MRRRLRRLAAFALVPLSAVPIVLAAPLIAPSFEGGLRSIGLLADERPAPPPTTPTTPERNR